jgi:AraC family ethanolamine operon transcriptional activator
MRTPHATTVATSEVDELVSAVRGLTVDYIRTSRGIGPCWAVSLAMDDVDITRGGMGFDASLTAQIPNDVYLFAVMHSAPQGTRWNDLPLIREQMLVVPPSCSVVGAEPQGVHETLCVVSVDALEQRATDLGIGLHKGTAPIVVRRDSGEVTQAVDDLLGSRGLADPSRVESFLLDILAVAAQPDSRSEAVTRRRLSSSRIVRRCLDSMDGPDRWNPPVSSLCRTAMCSESRLRLAFVEVTGLPPTLYFQRRMLNESRRRLADAEPGEQTVASIAGELGVVELGRFAGRYRHLFGEPPSATLGRRGRLRSR